MSASFSGSSQLDSKNLLTTSLSQAFMALLLRLMRVLTTITLLWRYRSPLPTSRSLSVCLSVCPSVCLYVHGALIALDESFDNNNLAMALQMPTANIQVCLSVCFIASLYIFLCMSTVKFCGMSFQRFCPAVNCVQFTRTFQVFSSFIS